MKKLFLVPALILSFVSVVTAQMQIKNYGNGAVVPANGTVQLYTAPEVNFKVTFDIKNLSAATKTYTAKRYDIQLNNEPVSTTTANAYFCFGGYCYGNTTTISPNSISLQANESASQKSGDYWMLIADLDEAQDVGLSLVKYTFMDVNNNADSVQVTIQYNDITTGIKEASVKSALKFSVSPNPSNSGLVTVKGDMDFTKVEVINQLGAVILSKNQPSVDGKINLDLSSSAPGVYFIRAFSGNKSRTEKLVITN